MPYGSMEEEYDTKDFENDAEQGCEHRLLSQTKNSAPRSTFVHQDEQGCEHRLLSQTQNSAPRSTIVHHESFVQSQKRKSLPEIEELEFSASQTFQKEPDGYIKNNLSPNTESCIIIKDTLEPPSIGYIKNNQESNSKASSVASSRCSTPPLKTIQDASVSLNFPWSRSATPTLGLDHKDTYDLAAKVILLGDYNVGKTSLLRTLSRAKDEDGTGCCKEYRPGELAEVVFRRDVKRAMVRIMDTGGQEKYRSLTSSYYRGVHGCLLMFDVTREETFNNIMGWHQDLSKYSTDQYVAAILIGTTSHLGNRAVSPEKGFKLAESLGIPYMECSPEDDVMTLAIMQRLMEKIIRIGLRRTSFVIEIKPQALEAKKPDVKQIVCLC